MNTTNSPEAQPRNHRKVESRPDLLNCPYCRTPIVGHGANMMRICLSGLPTPRAARETTVGASCLAELREMFPDSICSIHAECFTHDGENREYVVVTVRGGGLHTPHYTTCRTLADCMAQVRAATRTEGEG